MHHDEAIIFQKTYEVPTRNYDRCAMIWLKIALMTYYQQGCDVSKKSLAHKKGKE